MTIETAIAPTEQETDRKRKLTLLRAIGLDRVSPEARELALAIAKRYDLDLLLHHAVIIDGRLYVTRDGLLHVAHRSGQLDGIETTPPELVDGFWRSTCSVYRKDMSHPFTYAGRYPEKGSNAKFGPEMAVKVGEVMSLRRAFDVAAPTAEERWDRDIPDADPDPPKSLAEKVAERVTALEQPTPQEEASSPAEPEGVGAVESGSASTPPESGKLPAEPGSDLEAGLGLLPR